MATTIDSIVSQLQQASKGGSTSTTSSQYTPALDSLVQAFKASQQSKIDTLTTKQKELTKIQTFFTNLNSKLNNLLSNADKFTIINADEKFISRTVTSSDTSYATVSAGKDAILGVNTLKINRLATNDNLISKRINLTENSNLSGEKQFIIKSGSGEISPATITVDFGEGGLTNEEAMKKIVSAINARTDLKITASLIKDTNTTGRITFTAKESGTDNAIIFDDNNSGVLSEFLGFNNINNRETINNSEELARYQVTNANDLNSEAVINGIKVTNNSNTLTDVMPGVTINLLKTTEENKTITLTTEVSTKAIEDLINPLLNSYNETLKFLKSDKTILRNETSISNLYNIFRNLSTQQLKEVAGDDTLTPKYLTDIGIAIGSDGTLRLKDTTKLKDILQQDDGYKKVAELFTTKKDPANPNKPYGLADRLHEAVKTFVGYTDESGRRVEGIIKNRNYALSLQINSYNQRIKDTQNRIDQQANTLRKEYEKTLKVYLEAQSQYNYLYTYSTITSSS